MLGERLAGSAVATLVAVEGSAPRDPGAAMAIAPGGAVTGSISGGCVEAAIVQEAERLFAGATPRLFTYGIDGAAGESVGLICGGRLTVLLVRPDPQFVRAVARRGMPLAFAQRTDAAGIGHALAIYEHDYEGTLGRRSLDAATAREIRGSAGPAATVRRCGDDGEPHGEVTVFIERVLSRPELYVFGAIDFAAAMTRFGVLLGYRVTVCDARSAFAQAERFPDADAVICAWPDEFLQQASIDERTAIVALTHDEKFDLPLLLAALRTRAGYIGAMGSRATTERRLNQLRDAGIDEAAIARIHAPIGLDIGASTPEETALAIAAEIVAHRHGRSGGSLRDGHGPVRGRRAPTIA